MYFLIKKNKYILNYIGIELMWPDWAGKYKDNQDDQ
jgi:hypothetical protein